MIVVIADDLSGAAELAGAALRHGLSAEVQTVFSRETTAEVVCVDTDTRTLPPAAAAERAATVARAVIAAGPTWLFKKCDSVLRGAVLVEARAVAEASGQPRLLVIPANPSRQRTIRAGKYFVEGTPLHQTAFANDPVHPRTTADVRVLLGENLSPTELPDVSSAAQVAAAAAHLRRDTLPVGGADFFAALLDARVPRRPLSNPPFSLAGVPALLVCGSAATWTGRVREATGAGIASFPLPHDRAEIQRRLRAQEQVLVGIGDGPAARGIPSATLVHDLGLSVAQILAHSEPRRVLLEGGATAAAVIAALGWTRLRAERIADAGLGVMRPLAANAPLVFIKPGSYAWPPTVWPAVAP